MGPSRELCCGFCRAWSFGRLWGCLLGCVVSFPVLGHRGVVRTREGAAWSPSRRLAVFSMSFRSLCPSTRVSSSCHRAPLGRVKPANGLLALLRQPRRKRRAASWPRTPEKAKLSEPHGARRARSFRAHRRRALFHLRARGPRGAPKLLKNGRLGRGRLRYP